MTVGTRIRDAVETAVPALKGARWGVYAIGGFIALCGLLAAIWWVVIRPVTSEQKAAQAGVNAKLGTATGQIAVDAIPQINEATRQKVEVQVRVQKGIIDVRQQPDASTSIAGVSDAVLRAVCLPDDAPDAHRTEQPVHVDPACQRLAGADAKGASIPD